MQFPTVIHIAGNINPGIQIKAKVPVCTLNRMGTAHDDNNNNTSVPLEYKGNGIINKMTSSLI